MKHILIYDTDDKRIDKLCEKYDMSTAEVIETLLDSVENEEEVFG